MSVGNCWHCVLHEVCRNLLTGRQITCDCWTLECCSGQCTERLICFSTDSCQLQLQTASQICVQSICPFLVQKRFGLWNCCNLLGIPGTRENLFSCWNKIAAMFFFHFFTGNNVLCCVSLSGKKCMYIGLAFPLATTCSPDTVFGIIIWK